MAGSGCAARPLELDPRALDPLDKLDLGEPLVLLGVHGAHLEAGRVRREERAVGVGGGGRDEEEGDGDAHRAQGELRGWFLLTLQGARRSGRRGEAAPDTVSVL